MPKYIDADALEVVGFTDRQGSFSDGVQWLLEYIDKLPSADVQPVRHGRWIPVSEQLPEDGQEVLFSTKTGRVHLGRYHNDNSVNQWYSQLDKMRAWNNVVNAWMPLPEPYEERYED